MADGDWDKVNELSKEHETLKAEIESKTSLEALGKDLYEDDAVPIDPFSPGMNTIPGVARLGLAELWNKAKQHLQELSTMDQPWQTFYLRRIESFSHLQVETGPSTGQIRAFSGQLESEAVDALEEGELQKLARLAEGLSGSRKSNTAIDSGSKLATDENGPPDYRFEFNADTINRARKLGLELQHVASQHEKFAPLCRLAWHPTFAQQQDNHGGVLRIPDLPFPEGTPDALKVRVKLFATHSMMKPAGVRFPAKPCGRRCVGRNF